MALEENRYLLLTGATGLLGRSLLRDLSWAGRRVAVLVRRNRAATAAERVDDLLSDWLEVAGEQIAMPVVLEGDRGVDPSGGEKKVAFRQIFFNIIMHNGS